MWDHNTRFIYDTPSFSVFLEKANNLGDELRAYAMNRWYNFWSAMAVEYIFTTHQNVNANRNKYDKHVDFSIEGIPFDHKTSVYPRGFGKSIFYATTHKKELIQWLYNHQSQQGRKHLENRLFVVLYDSIAGEHWKMKSEISLMKDAVDKYMEEFDRTSLEELDFGKGKVFSDILWVHQ